MNIQTHENECRTREILDERQLAGTIVSQLLRPIQTKAIGRKCETTA